MKRFLALMALAAIVGGGGYAVSRAADEPRPEQLRDQARDLLVKAEALQKAGQQEEAQKVVGEAEKLLK